MFQMPTNPLSSRRYEGGGPVGQKVQQHETLTPGQREFLDSLTGQLTPQVGQGITPYQGERVAPFGPLQEQALGMAGGYEPGIRAGLKAYGGFDPAQGQDFLGIGQQILQSAGQPYDPTGAKEYWEQSFKAPAMQTWQRDIIPGLKESFSDGALNRALARSAESLGLGLSGQLGSILQSDRENYLNRQMQGAGLAGSFAQLPGQLATQGQQLAAGGLGEMGFMGAMEQALRQQTAEAQQQQWGEAQPYENPWLQRFASLVLGTPAFENIGFQGFYKPSTFETLAGAAAQGGGAYFGAKAASDRRLKDNIEPVENALEKVEQLEGKTFHYIWKPQAEREAGLIAQDLEKVLPEAVVEINGIKFIKYDGVIALLVNAVKELNQKIDVRDN